MTPLFVLAVVVVVGYLVVRNNPKLRAKLAALLAKLKK